MADVPNHLYIRDIFVNYMSNLREKSRFSYNFWWVDLDPNRNAVASMAQLEEETAKVFVEVEEALKKLVEAFCKYDPSRAVVDCTCRGYYECGVNFRSSDVPDRVKRRFMYYIYKLCGYPPDALAVLAEEESYKVDLTIHYGLVPVLMNWTWLDLVPAENLGDNKIEEKARKIVEKAKVVDESVLPLRIRGYVEFARWLARRLGLHDVEVKVVHGDSFYKPQAKLVALSIRELEDPVRGLEAIVHEIAHAYGDARYGCAPDVSENFELSTLLF